MKISYAVLCFCGQCRVVLALMVLAEGLRKRSVNVVFANRVNAHTFESVLSVGNTTKHDGNEACE
jgi:hypothetical protein